MNWKTAFELDAELKFPSCAIKTFTKQVPLDVEEIVADVELFESEQPEAVPPETMEILLVPLPLLPEVDTESV